MRCCGHDTQNPDSTWQQLPTILAGLHHNHCGVWSLDRLCGWLETKKETKKPSCGPARNSMLEMPQTNCPQPHFSQMAQEFKFCRQSPENSTFPKTLKSSSFSLDMTFREHAKEPPYIPLTQNQLLLQEARCNQLPQPPKHIQSLSERRERILLPCCLKFRHFKLPSWCSFFQIYIFQKG